MTAPPLKGTKLTCASKRRHPDESVARASAMDALSQPNTHRIKLYVYKCPECRGWHLTRSKHRNGVRVTATDPVATSDERLDGFTDVP